MRRLLTVAGLLVAVAVGAISTLAVNSQSDGSTEVRITAQRLEDGRTEFGLQQRTADGWSDRILPRGRYFPAEVETGRWLNSTPISVGDIGFQPIDIGAIAYSGDLWFRTDLLDHGLKTSVGLRVPLSSRSSLGHDSFDLVVGCASFGEPFVQMLVRGIYSDYRQVGWEEDLSAEVTYRAAGPYAAVTSSWSFAVFANSQTFQMPSDLVKTFMSHVRQNRSLEIRFSAWSTGGYAVEVSHTFNDPQRLIETFVQPNLDHCGEY